MVTREDIIEMYTHLRKTNSSISDEALDFMKNICIAKIESKTEVYVCTDFEVTLSDMKGRTKNVKQPPNGSIFQIEISNR